MRRAPIVGAVVLLAAAIGFLVSIPRGFDSPGESRTEVRPPPAADVAPRPEFSVTEAVLRPGETLRSILLRAELGREAAVAVATALRDVIDPRRLRPGERVRVARDEGGTVASVAYWPTLVAGHEVYPDDAGGWAVRPLAAPVETRVVPLVGQLESSLFETVDRLAEGPALAAKFVSLFEWDFDFAADCLPGDRIRLLVEKQYVDGEFVGYGEILIAQYEPVDRKALTAIAFEDAEGRVAHYDVEGRSVRKAFLRAPLDFTRITSGFSHNRRHPILGGVRPHLAIDYGAPTGTPVRAVADGVVTEAGWRGDNGISITIRHAHGYQTMYNHLSRVHVRRGQRVQQRDVVGRVGSTGLSTGPHLDYRVIKDGQFVNPLGESFVPGSPVPPGRRDVFDGRLAALLGRLDAEAPFAPGSDDPGP
jgi:murein DD-endopeptidase MepM/ murein hydrolase activator NlpD